MEAKWPSLYESAQFKCDMLAQYLQKFDWEDDDEDDDKTEFEYSSDSDSDDDEGEGKRRYPYKLSSVKEFLRQVRTTRGYKVDAVGTRSMNTPFLNVQQAFMHNYEEVLSNAIEVAINHINCKTGKVYEHVETSRVVDSPNRLLLLTFTAKTTDAVEQTFLATVYAPTFLAPIEEFELLECFLKPEGPAPWEYVDFKSYPDLKVF